MSDLAKQLVGEGGGDDRRGKHGSRLARRLIGEADPDYYDPDDPGFKNKMAGMGDTEYNMSPEERDTWRSRNYYGLGMDPEHGKKVKHARMPWDRFKHDELVLFNFPETPTFDEVQDLWELGRKRKSEKLMSAARDLSKRARSYSKHPKHTVKERPENPARQKQLKLAREAVPGIVAKVMESEGMRYTDSKSLGDREYYIEWLFYPHDNSFRVVYNPHRFQGSDGRWREGEGYPNLEALQRRLQKSVLAYPGLKRDPDVYGSVDIMAWTDYPERAAVTPNKTAEQAEDFKHASNTDKALMRGAKEFIESMGVKVVSIERKTWSFESYMVVNIKLPASKGHPLYDPSYSADAFVKRVGDRTFNYMKKTPYADPVELIHSKIAAAMKGKEEETPDADPFELIYPEIEAATKGKEKETDIAEFSVSYRVKE